MPQQGLPPSLMNSLAAQEQEPAATSAPINQIEEAGGEENYWKQRMYGFSAEAGLIGDRLRDHLAGGGSEGDEIGMSLAHRAEMARMNQELAHDKFREVQGRGAPAQEPTDSGGPMGTIPPSGSTIEPVPSGWFATLSNSAFFKQFTELTDETRQLLRAVTLPFVMYYETVDALNPWTRTSPLPQDEIDRIFGRAYIEEHFRRTPGSPTKDGYMDPADPWRSTDPRTGPWSRTIR